MNLKTSVAPQPAFGHPLLAPLVSTHVSVTQFPPPWELSSPIGGEEGRGSPLGVRGWSRRNRVQGF